MQATATAPGNPAEQLVAVAAIRAIAIYRDANPPAAYDPADDKTVIIKIAPEDQRLDRLQASIEHRLNPNGITRQALALIARLGDAFEHPDPEQAVEALGLVMAHAAVIARIGQLAIGPIIDLGVGLRRANAEPMRAAALVARAILGRIAPAAVRDPDRERLQIVEALGYSIAKAIDDVEIGHDVEVRDARELFTRIAGEVEAGKLPRPPAPEPYKPTRLEEWTAAANEARAERAVAAAERSALGPHLMVRGVPYPLNTDKQDALQQLQAAADELDEQPGRDMTMAQRAEEPTARHRRPGQLVVRTPRETIAVTGPADADPSEFREIMERELAHAAVRQDEEDAFMSTVATDGFAAAIVKQTGSPRRS